MKTLVIGGLGMLGHAMRDAFGDQPVVSVDRDDVDITDRQAVHRIIQRVAPSVVINCAAYTAVDQCETEESVADAVNGQAVGYIAQACAPQHIPLVHVSTDYVFDGQQKNGYREDDEPHPQNAYGRTKLHGEEALVQSTDAYYLVRTSWLYGASGKNFVDTMIQLGRTKPELRVVNDQHGKPTLTNDLAHFVRRLLDDRAPYGIYHGVNEGETTWYDFACAILDGASVSTPVIPCTTQEYPRPAKRPTWSTLHNTKRPLLRPWTEALRDYLRQLGYARDV